MPRFLKILIVLMLGVFFLFESARANPCSNVVGGALSRKAIGRDFRKALTTEFQEIRRMFLLYPDHEFLMINERGMPVRLNGPSVSEGI